MNIKQLHDLVEKMNKSNSPKTMLGKDDLVELSNEIKQLETEISKQSQQTVIVQAGRFPKK